MTYEIRTFVRKRIPVVVELLSGELVNLTAERHWSVRNVLTEIRDYLGIAESRLFGLATKSGMTSIVLLYFQMTCFFSRTLTPRCRHLKNKVLFDAWWVISWNIMSMVFYIYYSVLISMMYLIFRLCLHSEFPDAFYKSLLLWYMWWL